MTATPTRTSTGQWDLRELLLLSALGLLFASSAVVWATGRLAGLLFGEGRPATDLADSTGVLTRLPGSLADPQRAWPVADQLVLPGPAAWYAALVLVLAFCMSGCSVLAFLFRRQLAGLKPLPTAGPPSQHSTLLSPRVDAGPRWSEGFARVGDVQRLRVEHPQSGRVTLGHSYRQLIAAELEQSVLVVGATRSGKTTGFAIPNLNEWDGPALVLSAKTDLVHATIGARAGAGPVVVFDPTGVSGLPALGWSPLQEATDWAGAVRIANAMSRLSGTTDGLGGSNHWQRVAAQLLAPLMHAAAVDDRFGISELLSWVKTQRVGPAMAALVRTKNKVAAESLQSTLDTEQRQRDSAFNTVRTVLDAYEDPGVLAAAAGPQVDIPTLLGTGGTLYLVATAADQARLAPLFLGLVDQTLRARYLEASENRAKYGRPVPDGQRRLLLLLDEAANIAPLPDLATLASTAGGEGVQLLTIFQDLSQLRHRYGGEWGSIASNHVTKVLLPGVGDPETLQYFSRLSGEVEVLEQSQTSGDGRHSTTQARRRRPLQDEAALRALPAETGIVWTGILPPIRLGLRRRTGTDHDG